MKATSGVLLALAAALVITTSASACADTCHHNIVLLVLQTIVRAGLVRLQAQKWSLAWWPAIEKA